MKIQSFTQCLLLSTAIIFPAFASKARPNFVFILTDDQDVHMDSLEHMQSTQKHLISEGTQFIHHYCTVAICCPSRVNILTGKLAHNTNVTDVIPPYGGFPKFTSQGFHKNYLPLWFQSAGYSTYYSGKIFNAHTTENYNSPQLPGFNGSEFILDPFTYQYFNVSMTRNGATPVNYIGNYSPDLTAEKAYGFLDEALLHKKEKNVPFFLTVAPIAPHADVELYPTMKAGPPQVAERHRHLFKDYKIPRTANFNPAEVEYGASWIKSLPELNQTVIDHGDWYQRQRLRSLQAVDEMVEKIVHRLDDAGVLENTYIIYTSDNGYHISQHRMHPGKECGYETDINVPFVIRGPGIEKNKVSNAVTSHTDLAPTLLSLAGIPPRDDFDGRSLPLEIKANAKEILSDLIEQDVSEDIKSSTSSHEHVGIEFWGLAIPEGKYGYKGKYGFEDGFGNAYQNNTYKGLRIISHEYSLYYSVWCTNERELYDMKSDPFQVHNLLRSEGSLPDPYIMGRPLHQLVDRLDSLMMVLKSCKGRACVMPWEVLHPVGDVSSLKEALATHFDAFYNNQLRVSYDECRLGYFPEIEGPMDVHAYGERDEKYDGDMERQRPLFNGDWSVMT